MKRGFLLSSKPSQKNDDSRSTVAKPGVHSQAAMKKAFQEMEAWLEPPRPVADSRCQESSFSRHEGSGGASRDISARKKETYPRQNFKKSRKEDPPNSKTFEQLTNGLILRICSFLNRNEKLSASLVCKRWFKALWDNADWLSKKGWVTLHAPMDNPDPQLLMQSSAHLERLRKTRLASFRKFRLDWSFVPNTPSSLAVVLPRLTDVDGLRFDCVPSMDSRNIAILLDVVRNTCPKLTVLRAISPLTSARIVSPLYEPCKPFKHVSELDLGALVLTPDTWRNISTSFPALRMLRELVLNGGDFPPDLPKVSFKVWKVTLRDFVAKADVPSISQFCRRHDVRFIEDSLCSIFMPPPELLLDFALSLPQLERLTVEADHVDFNNPRWGKLAGLKRLTVIVTTQMSFSGPQYRSILQTFSQVQRVSFGGSLKLMHDSRDLCYRQLDHARPPLVRVDIGTKMPRSEAMLSWVKDQKSTWQLSKVMVPQALDFPLVKEFFHRPR